MMGTDPQVLQNAPQDLLDLLGFRLWHGYGRILSPRNSHIELGEKSLGELQVA